MDFAGMAIQEDKLTFSPRLPKEWKELSFKIHFKDSWFKVILTEQQTVYELISGEDLIFMHNNKEVLVEGSKQ